MKEIAVGLILITLSLVSFGQSKQVKINTIIQKLELVDNQKKHFIYQIQNLKYKATGNDSVAIDSIEKKLTDDEISKRLNVAFNEAFNEAEVNDLYDFVQSTVFTKIHNPEEFYEIIFLQFKDISNDIIEISKKYNEFIEEPEPKSEPIVVDKEDGFYVVVDYSGSIDDKNIKLAECPSLTSKDILEIKKEYNNYLLEISITLTKAGTKKFYKLTKENIEKPIAIVFDKKIISMPFVQSEIKNGKLNITGNFTELEIDSLIEKIVKNKP